MLSIVSYGTVPTAPKQWTAFINSTVTGREHTKVEGTYYTDEAQRAIRVDRPGYAPVISLYNAKAPDGTPGRGIQAAVVNGQCKAWCPVTSTFVDLLKLGDGKNGTSVAQDKGAATVRGKAVEEWTWTDGIGAFPVDSKTLYLAANYTPVQLKVDAPLSRMRETNDIQSWSTDALPVDTFTVNGLDQCPKASGCTPSVEQTPPALNLAPVALQIKHESGIRFDGDALARGLRAHSDILSSTPQKGDSSCSIDLRPKMPACKQEGVNWCWATGIAEWSFYYNVSSLAKGDNCSSAECSVVSTDLRTNCCPLSAHKGCGGDSAESVSEIVKTATKFNGRPFRSTSEPLSEAKLQAALLAGVPVMPIIHWENGGGHALMVAGCTPGKLVANYYLHDPERTYYEEVNYERLLNYMVLQPGKWVDTVMEDTTEVVEA